MSMRLAPRVNLKRDRRAAANRYNADVVKEQTNEDQNTSNFSVSLHRIIADDVLHALRTG